MVQHTATSVVTIERFIIEQERLHPEATGELSGVLYDVALDPDRTPQSNTGHRCSPETEPPNPQREPADAVPGAA